MKTNVCSPAGDYPERGTRSFWRELLDQIPEIDSVLALRDKPVNPVAKDSYASHSNGSIFNRRVGPDDAAIEAISQRVCVSGIFRYLDYQTDGDFQSDEPSPAEEADARASGSILLTSELLEMRLRLARPDLSMADFDFIFPMPHRYYVGLTSTMDFYRWKAKLLRTKRHYRRCGLTHTSLAKGAICDAFIQQPEADLISFLDRIHTTNGNIAELSKTPDFVAAIRGGLELVRKRFPRRSDERLKIEGMLRERDVAVPISQVMSIWNDYSVHWFLVREQLHDFILDPVPLTS